MNELTLLQRQEIAGTILKQLGGRNKLSAMIDANTFSFDLTGAISFHFKGCHNANIVKISLNVNDLYDITFYRYSKKTCKCPVRKEFHNVHVEQLKSTIEQYTKLYLSI